MSKTIIVTGSNKGIGQGIVSYLSQFHQKYTIIMAVRNLQLGTKTREQILLKYPSAKVILEQLDVSNNDSIAKFVNVIKEKYTQKIDVLLNNAGVAVKGDAFDTDVFDFTFKTNFYGTVQITQKMLPFINNNGKIITIGSMMGKMVYDKIKSNNQQLRAKYANPNLTRSQLFQLASQFRQSISNNTFSQKGWPKSVYGISKLSINLYCSILSKNEQILKRNIQVYSCCPGYVATDMTSHKGVLPVSQGIKTPVYLVQLPYQINQKLQGGFFQNQKLSTTLD